MAVKRTSSSCCQALQGLGFTVTVPLSQLGELLPVTGSTGQFKEGEMRVTGWIEIHRLQRITSRRIKSCLNFCSTVRKLLLRPSATAMSFLKSSSKGCRNAGLTEAAGDGAEAVQDVSSLHSCSVSGVWGGDNQQPPLPRPTNPLPFPQYLNCD